MPFSQEVQKMEPAQVITRAAERGDFRWKENSEDL